MTGINPGLTSGLFLDRVACVFHVFAEPMRRMAAGEQRSTGDRQQETQYGLSEHFHFDLSFMLNRSHLQPSQQRQDNDDDQQETDESAGPVSPPAAITPCRQHANQCEDQQNNQQCSKAHMYLSVPVRPRCNTTGFAPRRTLFHDRIWAWDCHGVLNPTGEKGTSNTQ